MSLYKQNEKTHVLASAIPFCWFKPCKEWTEGPEIQFLEMRIFTNPCPHGDTKYLNLCLHEHVDS
jgi:hypothetical protein